MISASDRQIAVELIEEAVAAGARKRLACEELGITVRTLQRWVRGGEIRRDARPTALRPAPAHKLTEIERAAVLKIVNEPRFAALPPTQIVPRLADEGRYVATESTIYRILRAEQQLTARTRVRTAVHREPPRRCAHAPNQLWCWDITYLPAAVRGTFFFLYLVLDVYSRKIVAHEVHAEESGHHAAALIERAVLRERIAGQPLVIHQDNGSPMKASTFVAKLQELGIDASYSRPSVSDDNAYAESLFRTCKYRPEYPGVFSSLDEARAWALRFERWYNCEHKHRNLKFISPAERHCGVDRAIFAARRKLYELARARHPARWSRNTRDWSLPDQVWLNRPTQQPIMREAA
jgi:transposase InsO family protein